jgi:hypothetical protein
MFTFFEEYQRGIDSRYVVNLMRAENMNESDAENRIRELFPIVREA